jgi:hypothetical protein
MAFDDLESFIPCDGDRAIEPGAPYDGAVSDRGRGRAIARPIF